jgi:gamma-glutamylcyclotransferase (GGCT)/AIG2-like uncharacterized protein YtfP
MGNRPHTRAILKGFRLAFMGQSSERKGAVVNLVSDSSRYVPGTLYSLDEVMIQYLDRAEAVEKGTYQGLEVEVEMDDGSKVPAVSYRLLDPAAMPGMPNLGYLLQIRQGYREWGLPDEILEEALCFK